MLFVAGGNWSAFEHTLTSLESGALSSSFFSIAPWNGGKKARRQESSMSGALTVRKENVSTAARIPEPTSVGVDDDINIAERTLLQTSTSPSFSVISDGTKPAPTVSSELLAYNSFDTVSVTSAAAQTLRDVNCPTVGDSGGPNVKDSQRGHQSRDLFTINKPARGKENIHPSGSQLEVPHSTAMKHVNLERLSVDQQRSSITTNTAASKNSTQYSKNNESAADMSRWRSPLRHSTNNAKNTCLAESRLRSRDSRKEPTLFDGTNDGFSALSVVGNDSIYDQQSPSKLSADGLNTNSDEVYKRSLSTPVKDQEPVRFSRRQRRSSSEETGKEQRKSLLQHFGEMSVPAGKVGEPVMRLNEQSSIPLVSEKPVVQAADTEAEMSAIVAERLSCRALSTSSLCDDSLINPDTTYESTILLSLPGQVSAESPRSPQRTSCPEVGTQTSLLLHSADRKTDTLSTSGKLHCLLLIFSSWYTYNNGANVYYIYLCRCHPNSQVLLLLLLLFSSVK